MHRYNYSSFFSNFSDFLYRRVKRIAPLYYLATFLILSQSFLLSPLKFDHLLESLYFAPNSAIQTNIQSAIWAVLFSTNLIRPDGLEGYAEKLGIAVDMFTHTWSLALEMQFYLLFPPIFIVTHSRDKKPINVVITILGIVLKEHLVTSTSSRVVLPILYHGRQFPLVQLCPLEDMAIHRRNSHLRQV